MSEPTYLVTGAPPNPNGDLHLGHLSGPFLGADVLRRYLALRGRTVHYVTYADDHSPYVLRKAEELGQSAQETAFRYSQRMEATLHLANMGPDYFEHPFREPVHDRVVHEFFLRLWHDGAFTVRELPAYWCERCARFLYEAHLRGRCQFCGVPADGFYCEECGRQQDTTGLREAVCIRCRQAPEERPVRRIVFPLGRYAHRLADRVAGGPWRPHLRAFLEENLERGLPDVPISRLSGYGIPVPLEGWEGHILDTWFSGIFGYMASTAGYAEAMGAPDRWREIWTDERTRLIHFIGFDCSFSHAILWPCLLLALGGMPLPEQVVTNEFYRLEGDKFSTSRGHAIWGSDFLRRFHADALRYHLCLTGPEVEQTSFRMKDFTATVNDFLVDRLEGWIRALFQLLRDDFDSTVPDPGAAEGGAPAVRELLHTLPVSLARALEPEGFSMRAAAACLRDTVEVAEASLRESRLRRMAGRTSRYAADLADQVELLATFAAASSAIMPTWSDELWRQLHLPPRTDPAGPRWPEPEQRLTEPGQRLVATPVSTFGRI